MRLPPLLFLTFPFLSIAVQQNCNVPLSPFRRLSNSIISSLWPLQNGRKVSDKHDDCAQVRLTPKPANLYSGDIVLRFNISTADEVSAIAQAAEELYLDIWEFTENWVDIRLAQSFVRLSSFQFRYHNSCDYRSPRY
jgi:hypothetical protein